jgi:hypothetical protein
VQNQEKQAKNMIQKSFIVDDFMDEFSVGGQEDEDHTISTMPSDRLKEDRSRRSDESGINEKQQCAINISAEVSQDKSPDTTNNPQMLTKGKPKHMSFGQPHNEIQELNDTVDAQNINKLLCLQLVRKEVNS